MLYSIALTDWRHQRWGRFHKESFHFWGPQNRYAMSSPSNNTQVQTPSVLLSMPCFSHIRIMGCRFIEGVKDSIGHVDVDACKIKTFSVQGDWSLDFAVNCKPLEMPSPISYCEPTLAFDTPPRSPVLEIADRESRILVTSEVELTYEVAVEHKVTHKAEQVRCYSGFLESSGLTVTDRNMNEPLISVSFSTTIQATIRGSFAT